MYNVNLKKKNCNRMYVIVQFCCREITYWFIMIMKWYFKALKDIAWLFSWSATHNMAVILWSSDMRIKTAARVIDALTYYSLIYCITHIYCVCEMFMMNQSAAAREFLRCWIPGLRHVTYIRVSEDVTSWINHW